MNMTNEQMEKSRTHALIECGKNIKYDFGSLFKNIIGRVSSNAEKYFCSEFVWINWKESGLLPYEVDQIIKAPRPGDLPKRFPKKELFQIDLKTIE